MLSALNRRKKRRNSVKMIPLILINFTSILWTAPKETTRTSNKNKKRMVGRKWKDEVPRNLFASYTCAGGRLTCLTHPPNGAISSIQWRHQVRHCVFTMYRQFNGRFLSCHLCQANRCLYMACLPVYGYFSFHGNCRATPFSEKGTQTKSLKKPPGSRERDVFSS